MSIDLGLPVRHESPDRLRDLWRIASLSGTWAFPGDWWCPAVDAVVDAVAEAADGGLTESRRALAAAAELGRHRARVAVSLAETLDDLTALADVVGGLHVPERMFREAALGWADEMSAVQFSASCVDPLTGCATPAYLRTRLGEVYAEAELLGADVGDTHALVVVDAGGARGLPAAIALISLRETLGAVFPGGETVAATGASLAVVLARRDAALIDRHRLLRDLLEARRVGERTWIERLPAALAGARDLIADLGR